MSNVITLNAPPRRQRLSERTAALVATFACHRRMQEDVFWLKENAELLGILECTGQRVSANTLEPLAPFYEDLPARLDFFPQYYRFLLSIGIDLEELGLPGAQMEALCHKAAKAGLAEAELSDLQRAEARRLLARRGVTPVVADPWLDDRLRAFVGRAATFALPNKKAAYELTHIVFYLSEYGRADPMLDTAALGSLEHAGTVAYLEQNIDLLAEICIALRCARLQPPMMWEDAVRAHLADYGVAPDDAAPLADRYHEYLVSTWAVLMMGHDDSGAAVSPGRNLFQPAQQTAGALRQVSAALMDMADSRCPDWDAMRNAVYDRISADACAILSEAEASSPRFAAFFETFARAPSAAV
ncbi:MAG: hypothetical protein AAFY39_03105 [Pseudomonadota bacterium]